MGVYLHDLVLDSDFLEWHLKHKPQKKNNKLKFIKLKNVCFSKDSIKKLRDKPQNGRKYLPNPVSDKGLVSRIFKELLKLTNKDKYPKQKVDKRT